MSDAQTLKIYAAQSQKYAALTNSDLSADPMLRDFIATLPRGGSALDLGCGPGTAAGVMANAGLQVHATDAVPEMIKLAAQNPLVHAEVQTFDQISGTNLYDGIWANFSLLHAERTALPNILQALHTALKSNGIFHIAMKLGKDTARDGIGRQYTYVTEEELRTLLTTAGFTITKKHTGSGKGLDGTYADWIAVGAYG